MLCMYVFFFFKQKTAYELRISDWSSDVCSSDLVGPGIHADYDSVMASFDAAPAGKRSVRRDLLTGNMFLAMDLSAQYKVGSAVSFQDKDGMSHRAILVRADKIGTRPDTMPVRMNDPRMIIDYLKEGRAGVYRTLGRVRPRTYEHTSAFQSLMRYSFAVF